MKRHAFFIIALLATGGCMVGPNYERPATTMPAGFGAAGAVATSEAPAERWWDTFNDPLLDRLLARAVEQNHDLRIATARVRQSRAMRGITAADLYPDLNVSGSATRQRISRNGLSSSQLPPGASFDRESSLFQAGFDSTWEIDLFGGTRRSIEAADADLAASIENRRDVLVSLLAEVARNYFELRGIQRRIVLTQDNINNQQETVELTRVRFDAGLNSELEVAQAQSQMAITASALPSLLTQQAQSIHRIGVLLGLQPTELQTELLPAGTLPPIPGSIPAGLPSDLLLRRADIRRAERQLAASNARIGVATADLFPRFNLTGQLGIQSTQLKSLANSDSLFWGIGPGFSWPIFSAGRIRSNIELAKAQNEEAVAVYEQAVLQCLEEVENALTTYANEQARYDSLQLAVDASQRALDLANDLYLQGNRDFLNVLQAQQSLFNAEDQLAQSRQNVATALVAVYKALGGGW